MAIGQVRGFAVYRMSKASVYILLCNNGRYYIGSTNDLDRRMSEHVNGQVSSTKNILPVELIFSQECANLTIARRTEYALKKRKSRKIIDQIVHDGIIKCAGD